MSPRWLQPLLSFVLVSLFARSWSGRQSAGRRPADSTQGNHARGKRSASVAGWRGRTWEGN